MCTLAIWCAVDTSLFCVKNFDFGLECIVKFLGCNFIFNLIFSWILIRFSVWFLVSQFSIQFVNFFNLYTIAPDYVVQFQGTVLFSIAKSNMVQPHCTLSSYAYDDLYLTIFMLLKIKPLKNFPLWTAKVLYNIWSINNYYTHAAAFVVQTSSGKHAQLHRFYINKI